MLSKGDDISRARLRKLDTVLNSLLTDKSSSRARLNKTKADDLPNTDNSDVSSSRARLSKTNTEDKLLQDNTFLETLLIPVPVPIDEPIDKDLPDTPAAHLSPEKRKEHNDENDRAVKRLKALLA